MLNKKIGFIKWLIRIANVLFSNESLALGLDIFVSSFSCLNDIQVIITFDVLWNSSNIYSLSYY